MNATDRALLREAVRRAEDVLAWIEARQGPLPDDGYARIETTVATVRRLAAALTVEPDHD